MLSEVVHLYMESITLATMSNKKAYFDFCAETKEIPLFMQPYWLDAIVGDAWDALVSYDKDGQIVGAWAIHERKQRGMKALVLPPMTPFTGMYLKVDETRPVQKQALQRQEILEDLIGQIPEVAIFEQKFQFTLEDWAPFYWAGFKQETRYTFRFEQPNAEEIREGLSKTLGRNLRSAERRFTIDVNDDIDEMFALVQNVFKLRDSQMVITLDELRSVYNVLQGRGQCAIYRAIEDDQVSAAVFVVWDDTTTYYLLGGRASSNTKHSTNLLLMRAIADAQERGHAFDFEGSMIKGVHRFFQSFGAEMKGYMYVYRYSGVAKVKYL